MERSKKRKREVDNPRITYHALTRTFDRLFKEESLAEMKEVARRKLGISLGTPIRLAQIRDGKFIDLDDDDDFDALYAVAHSTSLVNIQVTVGPETTIPESDSIPKKQKRRKPKSAVAQPDNIAPGFGARGQSVQTEMLSTNLQADPGTDDISILESVSVPPKKRRKKKASNTVDTNETHSQGTPTISPAKVLVPEIVQSSTIGLEKDVVTAEQEKGASGSKNARRKRQKSSQLQAPQVRGSEMVPGVQKIMTNESTTENPMGGSPKVREIPFAEQLAGAISESNEVNQRHSGASSVTDKARSGTRGSLKTNPRIAVISTTSGNEEVHHKNPFLSDVGENEQRQVRIATDSNKPTGAIRKSRTQGKASKTDELEAANADVKATALRILASKRALLAKETASNVRGTQESPCAPNGPVSGDVYRGHPLVNTCQRKIFDGASPRAVAAIDVVAENSSIPELSIPLARIEPKSADLEYFPPPVSNSLATRHLSSDSESTSDASYISLSRDAPDIYKSMVTPPILESAYTNVDLEALIRGPKIPLTIADITSPNFSDEEEQEGHLELEEDTQEKHSNHRSALRDGDSSEEETGDEMDDGDPSVRVAIEEKQLPLATETQSISPQGNSNPIIIPSRVIGSIVPSLKVDDVAHSSLEGDSDTVFKTGKEEATRSSDVIHNSGVESITGNSTSNLAITQALPHEFLSTQLITTDSGLTGNTEFSEKLSAVPPSIGIKVPNTPRRNGVIQRMRDRDGKFGQAKIDFATPLKFQQSGEPGTQHAIAKRTRSSTSSRSLRPLEGDASHNNRSFASVPPAKVKVHHTTTAGGPISPLASPIETSAKELSEAQSSVQKSIPLDTWVTLKPSSPLLDADSTTMIDELESSSSVKDDPVFNQHSSPKEPLFILTESQAPFPYSQWTGMAPEEDLDVVSNDSDDEETRDVPIRTRSQISNISKYSTYRKLTDITSQQTPFATPPVLQSTLPRPTKHKLAELYGPRSQKEGNEPESGSESDPDPDSDSDVSVLQEKSHIPEGRRAGVIQKTKK